MIGVSENEGSCQIGTVHGSVFGACQKDLQT